MLLRAALLATQDWACMTLPSHFLPQFSKGLRQHGQKCSGSHNNFCLFVLVVEAPCGQQAADPRAKVRHGPLWFCTFKALTLGGVCSLAIAGDSFCKAYFAHNWTELAWHAQGRHCLLADVRLVVSINC